MKCFFQKTTEQRIKNKDYWFKLENTIYIVFKKKYRYYLFTENSNSEAGKKLFFFQ